MTATEKDQETSQNQIRLTQAWANYTGFSVLMLAVWAGPKLFNQVPSLSLSRWRTLTLLKIYVDRLGDLMFQTSDKSQLLRRVLWINAQLTIVWSLKHKISQPIYIFNRQNSQNSESPNGPRRGLDFIALCFSTLATPSSILTLQQPC